MTSLTAPTPGWTAAADVVIVGSGVAGLTAALHARRTGRTVLLVTKGRVEEGLHPMGPGRHRSGTR